MRTLKRSVAVFMGDWIPYSETFIYDQLLAHRRYEAHVYAQGRTSGPAHAGAANFQRTTILSRPERWLWRNMRRAPRFSAQIARQHPAVAHAHFGTNASFAVPLLERRKIPLVTTFHAHDVEGLLPLHAATPRYRLYRKGAAELFRVSRLNLASSRELADMLVKQLGVPAKRVRWHRIGIDLSRFTTRTVDSASRVVSMVGRFVEKKGFEYGIAAFAQLSQQFPDARLRIAGAGPLLPRYKAVVRQEGLEDCVEFVGPLDHERVIELLQTSDVFLAPSVTDVQGDREGGLTVVKEASACGLGIVASYHGGIPEIVEHERTGLLAPERDVKALAEFLRVMLLDVGARAQFGRAARMKVEHDYSLTQQIDELESIFDEVS